MTMNAEERLRAAMRARLEPIAVSPPDPELLDHRIGHARRKRSRRIGTAMVVAVITFAVVGVAVLQDSDTKFADEANDPWVPPTPLPEGLQVELIAPQRVRTAEVLELRVRVTDDRGEFGGAALRFGDGHEAGGLPFDLVCSQTVREEPVEPPATEEIVERWSYRAVGTYTIEVEVVSGGCVAESENERASIVVVVEPGDTPSNGPLTPTAYIGHEYLVTDWMIEDHGYAPGQLGEVVTDFVGQDLDGFVSRLEVDWGDGSEMLVLEANRDACTEGPNRWPQGLIRGSSTGPPPSHRYAEEGIYTVRVRTVSVGCDGSEAQEATDERTISFPPPPGGGGYEPDDDNGSD